MRLLPLLLVGVIAISAVNAYGHYEHPETQGWFGSMVHTVNGWMPWSSKLGSDHYDTLHKVEGIYQNTHDEAQRRVDELKESLLKDDKNVQRKIAEIYHEEAERAEREIERLKHPLTETVAHWLHSGKGSMESTAERAAHAAAGGGITGTAAGKAAKHVASRSKEEVDKLTEDLKASYRSALERAKDMAAGATGSWEETKAKAAQAYSDAFHAGHGSSRTLLGKFRDTMGKGMRGGGKMAMKAVHTTWDMVTSAICGSMWAALGGFATVWGMALWRRRKFHKQLNANVQGPVIAVGEYLILGNEETQRKFFDFWSGPAAAYFNKQPGLRKQWMHRGVPGAMNTWLAYSEWATIDDLRRATRTQEYAEIKKRAPKAAACKMMLYQLGSIGMRNESGSEVDGPSKETAEQRGLRQRGSIPTAVHT